MNTTSISCETDQSTTVDELIVAFLRRQPAGITFPEVIQHLDDLGFATHGNAELGDTKKNLVWWANLSPEAVALSRDLMAAKRIVITPTPVMRYLQDNVFLAGYALAKQPPTGGYVKRRWQPALLALPGPGQQQREPRQTMEPDVNRCSGGISVDRSLWRVLNPGSVVRVDRKVPREHKPTAIVGEVIESRPSGVMVLMWATERAGRWHPESAPVWLWWDLIGTVRVLFAAEIASNDATARLLDIPTKRLISDALRESVPCQDDPRYHVRTALLLHRGVSLNDALAEIRRRVALAHETART